MQHHTRGVTLIELLIVVVIVGILAAIAYPSYRSTIIKSNRTEAKAALMQSAESLEKCYTSNHTYKDNGTGTLCPAAAALATPALTENGKYAISGAFDATNGMLFTLSAVPQGSQAQDSKCMTLKLDQSNVRYDTGTSAATPKDCW
jgi:type IV pilus assembly protein PilE